MKYKFTSMEQMAAFLEERAKDIRSRVAAARPQTQHVMRAEAHAYEQSAFIIRSAEIGGEE
jgi:hypothetical protein